MRQVSPERAAERPEREAVVERAKAAAGYRCELWWLGGCFGDLVGHELTHRSVNPGSHLVDGLVIAVCVGHNGWEDVQTNQVAEAAGARCSVWWVDRYGVPAIAAECRRIRRARARNDDPGPARWHLDDWDPAQDAVLQLPPARRIVQANATGVVPGAPGTWATDEPDPF